jgi:hypothetical protein
LFSTAAHTCKSFYAAGVCDCGLQVLAAATATGKKTDKLQSSLQVVTAHGRSCRACSLILAQALQAQLDRVISSQPMKRQDTPADAEVLQLASAIILDIARVQLMHWQMRGLRRQLKQLQASAL